MTRLTPLCALFSICILCFAASVAQQLNEEFPYGSSDNGDITAVSAWVRHSGSDGPRYVASGLSYSGYVSSGSGGSLQFTRGGSGVNDGDVHRSFSESLESTGSLYVSFLVRIDSAKGSADYFLHLGPSTIGSTFRGRVFTRASGTGWNIGLSKSTETRSEDTTTLAYDTVYLVVLRYDFSTASDQDDRVRLWVYDSGVPPEEPGNPLLAIGPVGGGVGGDPANLGSIAVRQGANTPSGLIDGIRVSTGWFGAPLPVRLTRLSATPLGSNVLLRWTTASELDNFGFDIERRAISGFQSVVGRTEWSVIGFVPGSGTTSSSREYQFIDRGLSVGCYSYRLRQIDLGGSSSFSETVEAEIYDVPPAATWSQNYPNPFNLSTVIEFRVEEASPARVELFDGAGHEVAVVFEGTLEAGRIYRVTFDGSGLSSGVYFCVLARGSERLTRKILLLK